MISVLITGEKSKLGLAFQSYIREKDTEQHYRLTALSLRGSEWLEHDFSQYDAILHCAGIFHAPVQEYAYYESINVTLTEKLAQKALKEGVKQFIYLSTMDIYGAQAQQPITAETAPCPDSLYGKSKLEAEQSLHRILDDTAMKLAVVRCCPVIGANAESQMEGYRKAFRLPIFPLMLLEDKRSILHVDTLCELLRMIIDEKGEGVFFPQNFPPLSVARILEIIKRKTGKKTVLVKLPKLFWIRNRHTNRIYGSSYYAEAVSNHYQGKYILSNSEQAIESVISVEKENVSRWSI